MVICRAAEHYTPTLHKILVQIPFPADTKNKKGAYPTQGKDAFVFKSLIRNTN
jgi:hypothetical protein